MVQRNQRMDREDFKQIAIIFVVEFFIIILLCIWLAWHGQQQVIKGRHYKQEFTGQELEILLAELQMNLPEGYTIYNSMYDSEFLYVEIYTEKPLQVLWSDLYGINRGESQFIPEEQWKTLDGETVDASTFHPTYYNSDLDALFLKCILWKKDNGYAVSVQKGVSFRNEDKLLDIYVRNQEQQ